MVTRANRLIEPDLDRVLAFCAEDPIERVYLEEVARRGPGRLVATVEGSAVTALCHVGANLVPSGRGCEVFADVAVAARPKMFIGNEQAVSDLWGAVRSRMQEPRDDRPGQPVFAITQAPEPGETGIREATRADFELLLPA